MKRPSPESHPKKIKKSNFGKIFAWTLYDFANTSFAIIVITFIYAVYFKEVVAEGKPIGDFYWSLGVSISMLITALISPVLGAIADYSRGKKGFLLFFSIICVFGTSMLYFVGEGAVFLGLLLFIIANIGFEAGLVFYDAFLPEITKPKNYGRVSGYGYAMGYFGSLASLGIALPFINQDMISETFPVSAVFFALFALPLFIFVKEKKNEVVRTESYAKIGFNRVYNTLKNLKDYKNLAIFLAAFFLYIEGVNTVIYFSGIYAKSTLGFSMQELILFFIVVQSTAIVGAVVFGLYADSTTQKRAIVISLIVWIFTIILAYVTSNPSNSVMQSLAGVLGKEGTALQKQSFYVVGLLAGSVMGATQSTSRSLMSKLTPLEKKTEFFGFFSFFGKSSAIVGPLVFGLVSYLAESQRLAILTVGIFFVFGLIVLHFVKDPGNKAEEQVTS